MIPFFDSLVAWMTDPANWRGPGGIPVRVLEHLVITGVSLAIAAAIALPIGIWIGHSGRFGTAAVNIANLGRALPSLALIALVLPITAAFDNQLGFKVYPTVVAMVVLAMPPILVNTYVGLAGVDRDLIEAARGMGMRERQILTRVELPLAIPVMVGGLRLSAVQIIATSTLGAIFGGPGLGRFLIDGDANHVDGEVLTGVFLIGALAIGTEVGFSLLQRLLTSRGLRLEQARARADDQRRTALTAG